MIANFNISSRASPLRFGPVRSVDRAVLRPFSGALVADAFWRAFPRLDDPKPIAVLRGQDRRLYWFGGFSGLRERGAVSAHILRAGWTEDWVRRAMWHEAICAHGVASEETSRWCAAIRREVPEDIRAWLFPRGLTQVAVAGMFGVTRQTAAKYMPAKASAFDR